MRRFVSLAGLCGILIALALPAGGGATIPGPVGLIAFRAVTGDGTQQIFKIDPVTKAQTQLTHVDGDTSTAPHWSPDMKLLTFEFDPANPTSNDFCHVAYMDADGGPVTVIPEANGDMCEASPAFGPDGRIYYDGFNGHKDTLFSMDLSGGDRQKITNCVGQGITGVEVSPDNEMLAFTCFNRHGDSAMFDSRIDGSHLRQLTPFSLPVGTREDWSPDSGRILFITTPGEGTPDSNVNTVTIRPDGSDLFHVTNFPAGGLQGFGNSYSPDGRWIIMRIEDNGQYALYKIKPNGDDLTQITDFSSFRPRGMAWGSECPCSTP